MKLASVLRIIAYGLPPHFVVKYFEMSKTTVRVEVKQFRAAVVEKLGPAYLCNPKDADIEGMLKQSERRGTPGLLVVMTAASGSGRTTRRLGTGSSKRRRRGPP